jgi:integrase
MEPFEMPNSSWVTDEKVRALAVATHPSGVQSYIFRYRAHGKSYKAALGRVGTLELDDARNKARAYVGAIALGRDPFAEEKAEKTRNHAALEERRRLKRAKKARAAGQVVDEDVFTIDAMVKAWVAPREEDKRSAKYITAVEKSLTTTFKPILDQPADQAGKDADGKDKADKFRDEIKKHLRIAKEGRGPAAAAFAQIALDSVFRQAIKDDKLSTNPCAKLVQPQLPGRKRILRAPEVKRIWRGAGLLPSPYKEFVRLLVATGVRRNEAKNARWSEFEPNARLWHLPEERMKAKRPFSVPLTYAARNALPIQGTSDFVFTVDGIHAIGGMGRIKSMLDEAIEKDGAGPLAPWVFHDLRHAIATWLSDRGVDYTICDLILAHGIPLSKSGKGYQHSFKIEERRLALNKWSAILDKPKEKRKPLQPKRRKPPMLRVVA